MQTTFLPFASGITGLMALSLLMSALAMIVIILTGLIYIYANQAAGGSLVLDQGWGALSFVLGKVWMVAMLPMVAVYSSIGGGAVSVIAAAQMIGNKAEGVATFVLVLTVALIGTVSLSGSLIAWTRVDGIIGRPERLRGRLAFALMLVVIALAIIGTLVARRRIALPGGLIYWLLGGLLFGILITLRVCQERMPAVIYLYNASTGLAVGLEGFMLQSPTLIVAGLLVGTTRMALTLAMARLPAAEADGVKDNAFQPPRSDLLSS